MCKTLQINQADAQKAFSNTDANGKKLLIDLFGKSNLSVNIMDRVKTFDDVLEVNGISKDQYRAKYADLEEDEFNYWKIKQICKALNEDWQPDWKDENQTKWIPWFESNKSGFSFHCVYYYSWRCSAGSRLCFRSADLAKYAATQFIDVYKLFLTA